MISTPQLIKRLAVVLNATVFLSYLAMCAPLVRDGLPPNADFTAFYTGWKIAISGDRLYDLETQRRYQAQESPDDLFLPYLNPPHLTLPFAPLAALPRSSASSVWLLAQLGLLAYLLHALWRAAARWEPLERLLMLSTVAASPFVITSLLNGAFSIAVALGLLKWCEALRAGEDARAGSWLVAASVKPQHILLPLAGLFGGRNRRAAAAFACLSAALTAASLAALGWGSLADYINLLREVANSPAGLGVFPERMPNLKSVLVSLGLPRPNAASLAGLAAGAALTFILWRRRRSPPELLAAFTISSGLFLSPHLNIQDGLSLAVPATLLYGYLRRNNLPRRAFACFAIGVPTLINAALLLNFMVAYWRLPLLLVTGLIGWSAIYVCRESRRERL